MPLSETDRLWFKANPGRLYRLEPVSPVESLLWPSPPAIGWTAWRITRFEDGARGDFQTNAETAPTDDDGPLGRTLSRVRREA